MRIFEIESGSFVGDLRGLVGEACRAEIDDTELRL